MATDDRADMKRQDPALLEIKLKHLENDLFVIRKESEETTKCYLEMFSNLEKVVSHRTEQVNKTREFLGLKSLELEVMLDASRAVIFYKDNKLRYIRVNRMFYEMVECPFNEIIGKTDEQLFTTGGHFNREEDQKVLLSGIPSLGKVEMITTLQGERTIQIDRIPYRDVSKKIIGIIGFGIDITEKLAAEEKNRISEERLNLALDAVNDGLWDRDIRTNEIYFSPRYYTMLGYDPYELPSSYDTWVSLLHPSDRDEAVRSAQDHTTNKKESYEAEFRMKTKSGDWRWILSRGKVVSWNTDGTPGRIVGIHTDITGRKQAEEDRARLAAAVDQAAEFIMIMDPAGTIQHINPAIEHVFGCRRHEIVGKNPFRSTCTIYTEAFSQEIMHTITSGKVWKGHMAAKKQDGSLCDLDTMISPVHNASGGIINFISISRDITNEVNLEHQLRQAQKMEAIGTLAGGVAHDFNNILAAIMGYAEMALEDTPEGETIHRNMKKLLYAANRAKDLIRQILDFSRQSEQEKRTMSLCPLIKETVQLLRASLPSTISISHHFDVSSDGIQCDPTQIHQLLMNLGANAAHALKDAVGRIDIVLNDVELDKDDSTFFTDMKPGPYLKLSVSDTGHGMERSVMDRIFDPYFTTKQKGEGTGLGLAVVHGIVKAHGGAINVYSEPGKGTRFDIILPKVDRTKETPRDDEKEVPIGSGTILFVDDEDIIADMGHQMLTRLGYTVVTVTSAPDALERFKRGPDSFDLVVADKTMPQMTGFDLAGEILKIRSDIPIILCTGFAEPADHEKARSTGITEYVLKPLVKHDIAVKIQRALKKTKQT